MKIFIILMVFISSVFAIDTGELSFFVMKSGKPLAEQKVIIFKKENVATINRSGEYNKHAEFMTDKDGQVYTVLPVGVYQLQLVAFENKMPQVFVRKNFIIKKEKESQFIVSLKEDNSIAFEDMEAPQIVATDVNTTEKKKGEGFIQLNLSSSEDQKGIKDARVFVKGLSVDVKSDEKGNVIVKMPEGEQTISIIHSNFSAQTIKVTVLPNETATKFVELTPAAMELEEFVVLAPQVQGSVAALTAEKKDSSAIADIVGSEQMSKKGDSNAAAALKRVSGVTIVDGKNIYVRGLGERYSSVELNSMPLPSPDPTKRVVPLDIFPASVIGSLKVQKTFSADITGNFAGGYVDLRTKDDVSEDYIKVSTAVKAHSSSLNGSKGTYYYGGDSDWTGHDDGTRAIPDSVLNAGEVVIGEPKPVFDPSAGFSEQELINMTKELGERQFNTFQDDVPIGFKGSLEGSKKFELGHGHTIGILANYSYDQSHKTLAEEYFTYSIDGAGNIDPNPENSGNTYKTKSEIKHGGIFNLSYSFADTFKAKYTKLYLLNTEEQTRITAGTLGSDNDLQRFYYLEWQERTLNIDQVTGSWNYNLLTDMQLDFGVEWATAEMYQPGNLKYKYIDYTGTGSRYELKTQSTQNLIYHNITSDDDVKSMYLKNGAELDLFSEADRLEVGLVLTQKIRESRANKFYLDSTNGTMDPNDMYSDPDSIVDKYVTDSTAAYDDMGLVAKTLFQPSDYYDAQYDETAFYGKVLLNPLESVEVSMGLRMVSIDQTIEDYVVDPQTGLITKRPSSLLVDRLLPNVDLKYKLTENDQFRASFSQSYILPDFREFSSSGYDHPDEVATVIGNPDLQVTDVTNLDFRYEHYYSPSESISGSLFYKSLENPIEDVSLPSTSLPIYSYINSDHADLLGLELDGYKNFDFIDNSLEHYYFSGNFSYNYSVVTLTPEQQEMYTSNNRQLQGLSPYVVNLSLGYDDTEGRSLNLAYNKMSERLRKVGLKNGRQEYPDQYEIPPHLLDFTWQERLYEGLDMKFKARNLLDGEVIWTEGENITKRYKAGRYYEVSLSYKY